MSDLSFNAGTDDLSSSSKAISDPIDFDLSTSINSTFTSTNNIFGISDETLQVLMIAIGIIIFLLCLAICISVCACVCMKRRRKSKRKEKQDHLLPEPVAKSSFSKSSKAPLNNAARTNGKQTASNQSATTSTAATSKPFYYDNLDDIPFIDDSRPTSVVDITQV